MARRPTGALAFALTLALLALACIAPAGFAGASPHARQAATAPLGGVNLAGPGGVSNNAEADREIREAHALGAKLVRIEVPWAVLEPQAPGQINATQLALTDRIVDDAAADGIGVIMLVDTTPCWASSAPESIRQGCVRGHGGGASAWPPSDPETAARFFAFLAERYGSKLAALEVWNEPDQANERYFAGPEKVVHYAALLRASYTAIKRVAPQVPVLGGSLVGANGAFLKALYAAGIKGYYDGLSVHFYTLTLASLRSFHQVQVENGDPAPLWLDEFGWPTCWPGQPAQQEIPCVTKQTQAANLTDLFRSLVRAPYVAAGVVFKLQDSPGEDFGMLAADGSHKPSFGALRRVLTTRTGATEPMTLRLRRSGSHLVASGAGPYGDFVQLEAFRGKALRYRAIFTLDRFNRYSLTLPASIGTRRLQVRVFEPWSGVARAARKSI
jgi:hypothetical protein